MAKYTVNPAGIEHCRELIDARQYVLRSEWGSVKPNAEAENRYLKSHSWEEYAGWFLGLTEGAQDGTKARCAFVSATSGASIAWASSPASTAPPSGVTTRS